MWLQADIRVALFLCIFYRTHSLSCLMQCRVSNSVVQTSANCIFCVFIISIVLAYFFEYKKAIFIERMLHSIHVTCPFSLCGVLVHLPVSGQRTFLLRTKKPGLRVYTNYLAEFHYPPVQVETYRLIVDTPIHLGTWGHNYYDT